MITASIKGGIFIYQYRERNGKVTLRGPKHAINLVIPYLNILAGKEQTGQCGK